MGPRSYMNHTMLRIADPKRSLDFYSKHFGMSVITELPVPQLGFTNYFLAFDGSSALWHNAPWYAREGVLELCHNHDASPSTFHANNGNKEPHRGFGHICFSVSDLEGTCSRLEADGVKFQKRLSDGRQHNIAFALDPDGYWIELIANSGDKTGIRFNHSMIRVKDKDVALDFYTNKLGMEVVDTRDFPSAEFTLFFLAFPGSSADFRGDREGLIELTYNYGTEKQTDLAYHNGNDAPQGFGHFGISVPNVGAELDRLAGMGVRIKKHLRDGKMKFVGFVLDADGYSIEILPQADFPEDIFAEDPKI